MGWYIAHRLVQGVVTMWLVTLGVFMLMRMTGDPLSFLLPPDATKEDREHFMQAYALNEPIWKQYLLFNKNVFTGSFGKSIRWDSREGLEVFLSRLPATLLLTSTAMVLSVAVGVVLGAVSAMRPDSFFDRLGKGVAILGQSMPVFWVGLLLILLFTVHLGWLPSAGGVDRLGLKGLILPALTLGWLFVASHMRIVRSSMLDALDADYIKMVRAKGLPRRTVIWKHALKNASIPIFTLFAVNFSQLISGAVVTETIFAWPGVGRLLVDSVFVRDFTVVQTVVFFAAAFVVTINIFVDVTYAWLDPRVRVMR
ncbi:MAG TPA: ABC transporter permease [Alphaproteobacteria bacterium]|nr:ABC transporter permease [Alphaproteobacteria bacterium]